MPPYAVWNMYFETRVGAFSCTNLVFLGAEVRITSVSNGSALFAEGDATESKDYSAKLASVEFTSVNVRLSTQDGSTLCMKTEGGNSGTDGVLGQLAASISAGGRLARCHL